MNKYGWEAMDTVNTAWYSLSTMSICLSSWIYWEYTAKVCRSVQMLHTICDAATAKHLPILRRYTAETAVCAYACVFVSMHKRCVHTQIHWSYCIRVSLTIYILCCQLVCSTWRTHYHSLTFMYRCKRSPDLFSDLLHVWKITITWCHGLASH